MLHWIACFKVNFTAFQLSIMFTNTLYQSLLTNLFARTCLIPLRSKLKFWLIVNVTLNYIVDCVFVWFPFQMVKQKQGINYYLNHVLLMSVNILIKQFNFNKALKTSFFCFCWQLLMKVNLIYVLSKSATLALTKRWDERKRFM